MYYRRTGFPEEGEVVLCTVTKVQSHSVFVRLDEFDKSGMIHISEVSPGRIRNIRDFVREDKVIVCQVLRVNKERGYIDLSLRRVNENLRRKKIEAMKQEQKAEKLIDAIAEQLKKKPQQVYVDIFTPITKQYMFLHQCFQDVAKGDITLEELQIPEQYIKSLQEIIQQRIKPKEVYVGGKLSLQTYMPNGVEVIKSALRAGIETTKEYTTITYLGGGSYNVLIRSEEYKQAEQRLEKTLRTIENQLPKGKASMNFLREEKKAAAAA